MGHAVFTSWDERSSRRQLPPRPGPGGQALEAGQCSDTGQGPVPPGSGTDQTRADLRARKSRQHRQHTPAERAGHPVASGRRQARYDAGETSTGTGACPVVRTGLDVLARTRFPHHRARNSQPEKARNPCSARWGWVAGVPAGRFVQSADGMGDSRLEPLVLSEAERRTLENWAKRRKQLKGWRCGHGSSWPARTAGPISPSPRGWASAAAP